MHKVTVLYGHPEDPEAFEEYYANTHLPIAAKIPNMQRFEAGKVLATPDGGETPYHRIAEIWIDDMDQLQKSMGSEEGQAATGDIPNFATGGVTVFISEVE
ncbi:MAG: EthD family reductase [Rubrobacter sp.]|nr:EthD family reductase [Rubrobacter sp.]